MAIAVDLYGGNVATKADDAKKYMQSVDPAVGKETMTKWMNWSRTNRRSSGKVATVGWCFGGGWSLNTSLAAPADATGV